MNKTAFTTYKDRVISNCARVICGKEEEIRLVLIAFVCGGHILIEDRPGTGKTVLLRSFAKSIGGSFRRIQFTPDLLPSDLTGLNFFNQKISEFVFRPGPLFANFVLADEINRASPRTQAALLEAMGEKQISVDGTTYPLEEPFMVLATQNPLDSMGTFPLPDAQLDRFFMRISLGYMEREQEMEIMARRSALSILEELAQVVTPEETEEVRRGCREITVSQPVKEYIMDIIEETRRERNSLNGVSTRGTINLYQAAQAEAAFSGRSYVIPEDVKFVAPYVLGHRVCAGGGIQGESGQWRVEQLLKSIAVPLEKL